MSKEKDALITVLVDFTKEYIWLEVSGVRRDEEGNFYRDRIHPNRMQQLYVALDEFRKVNEIEGDQP